MKLQQPGQNMVQKVKLEMSFSQVFELCFKVFLAQLILVPLLLMAFWVILLVLAALGLHLF